MTKRIRLLSPSLKKYVRLALLPLYVAEAAARYVRVGLSAVKAALDVASASRRASLVRLLSMNMEWHLSIASIAVGAMYA